MPEDSAKSQFGSPVTTRLQRRNSDGGDQRQAVTWYIPPAGLSRIYTAEQAPHASVAYVSARTLAGASAKGQFLYGPAWSGSTRR